LLIAILMAGCIWTGLARDASPALRAVAGIGALLFGVGLFFPLCRSWARGPAFVISPDGFFLPSFSDQMIPWSEVTALNRLKYGRTDSLKMLLEPAFASSLPRSNSASLGERVSGRRTTSAVVPLNLLSCEPDAVVAQCAAYVEMAQERSWREMLARGETPPIAPILAQIRSHRPWLTYMLLAMLALVYAGELQFAVNANNHGEPSVLTLAYLGGVIGNRIWLNGEWWRLFTAPFLHAGVMHLLFNGIVLWSAGTALERLLGWRWLGAIFAVSALGGSFASVLFNAPNIVGVGASGGIMGVLAALFVICFRLPESGLRTRLQIRAMQTVIPALLPFLSSGGGPKIDYAAHFGGFLAGGFLAFLIHQIWPHEQSEPRYGVFAAIFAFAFVLISAGSIIPVYHLRQLYGH